MSFSRDSGISDDSLDFRGFLSFFSGGGSEFSSNNALLNQSNIVFLLQVKEFSNLVSSLGTQSSGNISISQFGDFGFTFFGDGY